MATAVRRNRSTTANEVIDPQSVFAEHVVLKRQAAAVTTRADALKDRLKKWFQTNTSGDIYENEAGSKFFDFTETVSDGKDDFKGMELRHSTVTKFNEETAEAILKRKGVYEEALSTFVDQDKVYRLLQEEKITEKDLDKMFEATDRWAFYPVKGEVY